MKLMYDPIIYVQPESVDHEKFIIATYYVEAKTCDYLLRAGALAVEQTTGTWVSVPEETSEVRRVHVGRVIGVHPIPPWEDAFPEDEAAGKFVVQIAFPWENIGQQMPELLSTVIGNISMGRIKLIDIAFPESWAKGFKGPRFGIPGMRKLLGIEKGPLILGMIKPCTGISPKIIGDVYYRLASAGVELIKDDELIADPIHAPWEARLENCLEAGLRAQKETGRKNLYILNVTDRQDKMLRKAQDAVKAGCEALMVNIHATGYGTIQMLAEDDSLNVPILAHCAYSGTHYMSPFSGISSHLVYGKFMRLDGADIIVHPISYGKLPMIRERYIRATQSLLAPFYHIKPAWSLPAAGTHPGMVRKMIQECSEDIIIGCGGAMHGHPMGEKAGVMAMRQAIDAAVNEEDLTDAASKHKELEVALQLWGDAYGNNPFDLVK